LLQVSDLYGRSNGDGRNPRKPQFAHGCGGKVSAAA
jgi:hypothetical protein